MKVVFDTNVLISRLLSPGSAPAQAVNKGLSSGLVMASYDTLTELSDVLSRKKFDKYISIEDRKTFLRLYIHTIEKIEIIRTVQECRDPKDDKFLELALNGEADFLITGDTDLLRFKTYHHTLILTPAAFLERI